MYCVDWRYFFTFAHAGGYYFEFSCKFTENGRHENLRRNGPVQGTVESGNIKFRRGLHNNGILFHRNKTK